MNVKFARSFFVILTSLFLYSSHLHAQKITDTIYYNKNWAICEKTIASYYRMGTLAIDSFWFYTGIIKDYTIKDSLLMEGSYSEDGYKDGHFAFYYRNGNIRMSGDYSRDKMIGNWKWNYPDGTEHAVIYFPGGKNDFTFITYRDEKRQLQLENGNGDFTWYSEPSASDINGFKLTGSCKDGKRVGTWKYYDSRTNTLICKEVYKDGLFKRGRMETYSNNRIDSSVLEFEFMPIKIKITETIAYDDFFRKGGTDKGDMALTNYLLNRKTAEIFLKDSAFENAFRNMLHTLDSYREKLDFRNKDIDGFIEFYLGEKNAPEKITVQAINISEQEKEFLLFVMNKFVNIKMPVTDAVEIEGYHKIYFYSINIKEFFPANIREYVGKELFFTPLKKEAFLNLLKANKKAFKKYIRNEYLNFW
jgi:antitoxin component YwqK of YwqJK toxin-antitoxin module